jgi:Flp pilus assembly protein TadD
LAELGKCPTWAVDLAWGALGSIDSAQRYKVSKAIFTSNPKSRPARTNFITVALLARNDADAPHRLAETLYEENPSDAVVAATYSFSLLQQGRFEQAVATLRAQGLEKFRESRAALFSAIVLAAAGETGQAKENLRIASSDPLLPEERTMSEILQLAFQWEDFNRNGNVQNASGVWAKAVVRAQNEPELLEALGRMALKLAAPERASEALWKRAELGSCPRWALDHLWAESELKGESAQLYKVAVLLRRANPSDAIVQSNFVRLSLLTGHDADFPHRLAEALYRENPGVGDAAITYALSLYLQDKAKDAAALLGGLKRDVLRTPRASLYYGVSLARAGEAGKAQEYLQLAAGLPLLPEERALVAGSK